MPRSTGPEGHLTQPGATAPRAAPSQPERPWLDTFRTGKDPQSLSRPLPAPGLGGTRENDPEKVLGVAAAPVPSVRDTLPRSPFCPGVPFLPPFSSPPHPGSRGHGCRRPQPSPRRQLDPRERLQQPQREPVISWDQQRGSPKVAQGVSQKENPEVPGSSAAGPDSPTPTHTHHTHPHPCTPKLTLTLTTEDLLLAAPS